MVQVATKPSTARLLTLLGDVHANLGASQPELGARIADGHVVVEGNLLVNSPDGPYDFFQVRMILSAEYPDDEPVVWETGGRIERVSARHIFEKRGDCCLGVWEEWLLTSPGHSFAAYMQGPVNDYFVSQTWYEAHGDWPYGQRSHNRIGIVESYCEILGIPTDEQRARAHLELLSRLEVKGHHPCPCRSGERLRRCHWARMLKLRVRIGRVMAKRMLSRLTN